MSFKEEPITQEMIDFITPMVEYQKKNNITGMRLMNALLIHQRFPEYKPKAGVVIALCPNTKTKETAMIIVPHCWSEKNPYNKLESSIDVLQFGRDIGQYELSTFLNDCKTEPLKSMADETMKRRIIEEVVGLTQLIDAILGNKVSIEQMCSDMMKMEGDNSLAKYYYAIKDIHKKQNKTYT